MSHKTLYHLCMFYMYCIATATYFTILRKPYELRAPPCTTDRPSVHNRPALRAQQSGPLAPLHPYVAHFLKFAWD